MERSLQGLFKTCNLLLLSIPETKKNVFKRPEPLLESYTGNTEKSGSFCKIISPAFFETVSEQKIAICNTVNLRRC